MTLLPKTISEQFDDDGRPRRTGTVWTASAHIVTAVIGSGVLSLAWAMAQLGWVAGPFIMLLFSFVTYYTSILLSECYRSGGDPVSGKRNYNYMNAVRSNLGGVKVVLCGVIQYINMVGVAISYTIAASISMMAIRRSNCFHESGGGNGCRIPSNPYMITFGAIQVVASQIPNMGQIWWLSIVAAVMSFTYASIGMGLGIAKVSETGTIAGTLTAAATLSEPRKIWQSFQAVGDIAFAYSYSMILIEIQDTLRSPPSEAATMKTAARLSVAATTVFYMLCAGSGYAAFGHLAPSNILTGTALSHPYWLLDLANAAIVVHLVGAYQVYSQPVFALVEEGLAGDLLSGQVSLAPRGRLTAPRITLFRAVWRTAFVAGTTVLAMLLPFFNDVVGILGALGFWPLTVYFPVEMYIVHKKVPSWGPHWLCLKLLSFACLLVSAAAALGSIAGIVLDLRLYKPFQVGGY